MSNMACHEEYLSLMERFLRKDLEVTAFCSKFTALWTGCRDADYAKKALWQQPYDELLIAEWQRGEIGAEEFHQKWGNLWGYTETDTAFQSIIDALHSACYQFRPFPERQGEISEDELRQEVQEALVQCQKWNKPLTQAA